MIDVDPDWSYRVVAAFFAELAAHGVRHVVVSPGSRSTPLTVTAHSTVGLTTHVMLDERAASFFALGLARAGGRPVVLICTSGTAAANYLPAVVEAHYSQVPLIVCTADRPPELRDRGAGQTIDQVGLYGTHVRWAVDLPVASDVDEPFAQRMAARAIAAADASHPGPVHCNWPLRDPLTPVDWTPASPVRSGPAVRLHRPLAAIDDDSLAGLAVRATTERGVIVVGPGDLAHLGEAVARLSSTTGWPVLAEATSSLRTGPHIGDLPFLTHWDLLVRHDGWARHHRPELVVRLGGPPTSKALRLWLERHRPELVVVDRAARFDDPSSLIVDMVAIDPAAALAALTPEGRERTLTDWTRVWQAADAALRVDVARVLDDGPLLECATVTAVDRALPADAVLVVSNSMPVRDVDGYLPTSPRPLRVMANRGAAGIDGVTSFAYGVAALGTPTVLLTGDIAFVHDIGGLHAGLRAGLDLTIVVPDNGGGGIFEFLPIAHRPDVDVETLFITPSDIDWSGLASLRGLNVRDVANAADLEDAVTESVGRPGVDVIRVVVDRRANVAQHAELAGLVDRLAP